MKKLIASDPKKITAFTIRELFAVLSVVTLLVLIHAASIASSSHDSAGTVCRSNLRRLTLAWHLYAGDNNGNLPVAAPGGSASTPQWAGGDWLDIPSDDAAEFNHELSTKKSPLWPYILDTRPWRCPADWTFAGPP